LVGSIGAESGIIRKEELKDENMRDKYMFFCPKSQTLGVLLILDFMNSENAEGLGRSSPCPLIPHGICFGRDLTHFGDFLPPTFHVESSITNIRIIEIIGQINTEQ
jgi:hypothetical protein